MNMLASVLADRIRSYISNVAALNSSQELRLIFLGPPHELMSAVFNDLTDTANLTEVTDLPYLLQVPRNVLGNGNPEVGHSGYCDEDHLLDLRNLPKAASFVALVPPGEHSILSVGSTTHKFGVAEANNSINTTFEAWWTDSFVQSLVLEALSKISIDNDFVEEALQVIETAAKAADEVENEASPRSGAWHLISRLFSIKSASMLKPGVAISLACGLPPMRDGTLDAKRQLSTLKDIAECMSDGFGRGVKRLISENNNNEDAGYLLKFESHVRSSCRVATMFERATTSYYRPTNTLEIPDVPDWWLALDVEKWAGLLPDEPQQTGDIEITCKNSLISLGKSLPAIVADDIQLQINATGENLNGVLIDIKRTPAAGNGFLGSVKADNSDGITDYNVPPHKGALAYKATANGFKPASVKVVSLSAWQAGILIICRQARKFAPPRKLTANSGVNFESSLSLPGPGYYELLVFVSPDVILDSHASFVTDQDDGIDGEHVTVSLRKASPEMYRAEIEANGNCQFDVKFSRNIKNGNTSRETCRVYISCEDIPEVGCRSEFERLIKVNRQHIENFDAKAVISVNRAVRSTMLQDWILSDDMVRISYQPIVLAEDSDEHWSLPDWGSGNGPILSGSSFIKDPRPSPGEFNPPAEFLESREKIARYVRGTKDQAGVFETARLGELSLRDAKFACLVESYLDTYQKWISSDPKIACWVDVIAICSLDSNKRSLIREPIAVMLSPLHPLRLGWHVAAQRMLFEADDVGKPCPAASVLDPNCVPDILSLAVVSANGRDQVDYLSVENSTDYWSVLWNGRELERIPERSQAAPFGEDFGINVGGISAGFSAAQVKRALDDVSELLAAKPIVAVAVSSTGGSTDACNLGLVEWCSSRFETNSKKPKISAVGARFVEVFDDRPIGVRPDEATISNLTEDTGNSVRWFYGYPVGAFPDLGIIAQLNVSEPRCVNVQGRSPLSAGGMIRHRIRRQLPDAFLVETRQSSLPKSTSEPILDKVASLITTVESLGPQKIGLQLAPDIHQIQHMLRERRTDFVAVSSAAIDPSCFLGAWLGEAYLWDFDLPAYSQRAGDTNGYYLLSQVTDADRDALSHALARLPGCENLEANKIQDVLLEVSRRGIPTIKGLAGDDTGATGDIGVFVGVRLLQDSFRGWNNTGNSLLPVIGGTAEDPTLAIIVPLDPFRGYISDLRKSLNKDKGDYSHLRPDVVVIGINFSGDKVRIKITPIEIKCRPTSRFSTKDSLDALEQAKAFSSLMVGMQHNDGQPQIWAIAYQHLLLSIIDFGLRVYSQHHDMVGYSSRWSEYHEKIATAILNDDQCVEIDKRGRLIILDDSPESKPQDFDNDGFEETVILSRSDASKIVTQDPTGVYDMIRARLKDWDLMPIPYMAHETTAKAISEVQEVGSAHSENVFLTENQVYPEGNMSLCPSSLSRVEEQSAPNRPGNGVSLQIGRTIDGFRPRDIELNISDTRLNQLNIGVVGDLGTGKTQLLKSLITQISSSGPENRGHKPSFLIFDYKRDYSSDDFIAATNARIVRPHKIPLNLFDTRTIGDVPKPWFDRFRFFADVLDKIYSGIGPVQREKLKLAVKSAYEATSPGSPPTLRDVHEAYHNIVDGRPDSPMSIIGDILDMEIFEEDLSKTVTFDKFLDGVVVISLDALGQDDRSKNLLVAIMLNMFYENMLKTQKKAFIGHAPQLRAIESYLLVDEADNIMRYEFDVLRKLLLQGREFGTGVILASQYLRHFKSGGTDYREPLLTWFIHKVPNINTAELSALGLTATAADLAERVKSLDNHQCLYKSFDSPGEVLRGLPFYELSMKNILVSS